MGLSVVLEDERGERQGTPIEDPKGFLTSELPPVEGKGYAYLPYIDRYGDTIFNRPQMVPFLREWQQLQRSVSGIEPRMLMEQVEQLAIECRDSVHLYLRFVGD